MDNFIRKHLTFLSTFWNKFLSNSVPSNCSLECWEPSPASLKTTLEPDPAESHSSLYGVLYDYTARSADELSVSRGDRLCVLKDAGEYVLARRISGDQVVGYVPATYISKLSQEPAAQQS